MQGNLWEGFPEYLWEVVEIRTDPEVKYINPDTGEIEDSVVYCKTRPLKPIVINESIDPLFG